MARLTRLVLDVLKPHEPDHVALCGRLADLPGVSSVDIRVDELDRKTATVAVELRGDDLDLPAIVRAIEDDGGAVHSVDEVAASGDAPS